MKTLSLFVFFAMSVIALASPPPKEKPLKLFLVPWALQINPTGRSPAVSCPLCPNILEDCLPGPLYNVKQVFESFDVKFDKDDFAWFSPSKNILVVRASPVTINFIVTYINSELYCPSSNINLDASLNIEATSESSKNKTPFVRWKSVTQSGTRVTSSSEGSTGINYSFECEPVIATDGQTVELSFSIEATFNRRKYSTVTRFETLTSKPKTILLGTSLEEKMNFSITPTLEVIEAIQKLDKEDEGRILECIKRQLKAQQDAAANP